ncbi:hypothetical protein FAES_2017 [Fibrella aestuarina BUZ 2]|uniref:Lipoprotein n=1 Tax=Fibrella aestuarina BUZ 2 TaxID=1166018 RepID=I0K7C3_9BACT|nr:hypothetical protein [Fibrella aestuarina]CCH00026.1 hypothetical protein FAES_2017 [Fibrella aestuarina BUZ 2]
MKRNWLLGAMGVLWLAGCTASPDVAPNDDIDALHERFHGKYSIVSSVSNEAIDVNMDGYASTNLLDEIKELAPEYCCELILHVRGKGQWNTQPVRLMVEAWPEQYIWSGNDQWNWEPLAYDPKLTVNYARQGASRSISFAPDLKSIIVADEPNADASVRWKKPVSVRIVGQHTIELVSRKTIYTRAGTKTVLITTRYERYTMTT